jgi:hypothetical protein
MTVDAIDRFSLDLGLSETDELAYPISTALQFYYHITNQAAAGESLEFPVITDAALGNLHLTQRLAGDRFVDVALFDINGVPRTTLTTSSVFVESLDTNVYQPVDVLGVTLTGELSTDVIEVQTQPDGPIHVVRVDPAFRIDVDSPVPGYFAAICVEDREGCRYTVGTLGIAAAI